MKLFKLLQSQGIGSRKECLAAISQGRVVVKGKTLRNPKEEINPFDGFVIDGEFVPYAEKLYIALYKPVGYECSHRPQHHKSVYSLLPDVFLNRGVEAAGRLDADTTGLLLLSDDGQFIHQIMSPKKKCHKVYEVVTKHTINEDALSALRTGVKLNDSAEPIRAIGVEAISDHLLRLEITEGKYHQVKRMIAAISNRVEKLHRISVGGCDLDSLRLSEGEYVVLKREQLEKTELYDKCIFTL